MVEYVDPARFAGEREAMIGELNPRSAVEEIVRATVTAGRTAGLLQGNDSFGGIVTLPLFSMAEFGGKAIIDPYSLVWFPFGWGAQQDQCQANAFRKLIPTIMAGESGLALRLRRYSFPDPVPSADDDGRSPMGSYPYAGAVVERVGQFFIGAAVDGLHEVDNHAFAAFIANLVGGWFVRWDSATSQIFSD